MFIEIFKELIEEKDDGKYSRFCEETDIPKTTVSGWINNNQLPRYEQLIKIARHFNVSADYLLGISENENGINEKLNNQRYEKLLYETRRFNETQLDLLEKYIELLKKVR